VWENHEEYAKVYNRLNSGKHDLSWEESMRIEELNKAKIQAGEIIVQKPAVIPHLIDISGSLLKRKGLWHPFGQTHEVME